MRYRRNTEETNFWAGYADCMLALFMIALVLWILSAGITAFTDSKLAGIVDKNERLIVENEKLKAENEALRKELEDESDWYAKYKEQEQELEGLKLKIKSLQEQIAEMIALQPRVEALNSKLSWASDWHKAYANAEPVSVNAAQDQAKIKLEEKIASVDLNGVENVKVIDNFIVRINELQSMNNALLKENEKVLVEIAGTGETFESGNAVINRAFREKLGRFDGPFSKLADNIKERRGKVVLEIIGHTDGQPLSSEKGNLDTKLPYYLTDIDYNVKNLKAGSNNDLGLLRALAIRKAWIAYVKEHSDHDELNLVVHCYSAGQTIPPADTKLKPPEAYSVENEASRRIEMRLRNVD